MNRKTRRIKRSRSAPAPRGAAIHDQINPDIQLDFMNGTVVEFASSENTARAIVQEQDGVRDIWYSVATNIPADVINIINNSPFVATN